MEPIINPWVFYLMDIVDSWELIFEFMGVLGCLLFVGFFIAEKVKEYCEYAQSEIEMLKSIRKFLMKLSIPLLILGILLPTSSTIYKMIVAKNVTPNNIQIVGDTVEDGIDYIFDKINEVVDEKGEEE